MTKPSDILALPAPGLYLRNALKQRQFALYGQSILALKGGPAYPLAEIFVRMREEQNTMLPPDEFVPVFQSLGMMPELDRWVVRETLSQTPRQSAIQSFCINVSAQTLEDRKFVAFVERELRFTEASGERLIFEVSELDVRTALEPAIRFADELRAMGGRLVLEDFRGEKASYEILRALRPQYLKLDGALVRKLGASEAAQSAIKIAINVARPAKIAVVAESVEDEATLIQLRRLGADYAQGFGIHAPAPIESLLSPAP